MDINTIATISALTIAFWTIVPSSKRNELIIKITWVTKIYLGLIISILLFIQFKNSISNFFSYFSINLSEFSFNLGFLSIFSETEIILILLFLLSLPFFIKKRLHSSKYNNFIKLCNDFFYEKKYDYLVSIISSNAENLHTISKRKYFKAIVEDKFKKFIFKYSKYPDNPKIQNALNKALNKEEIKTDNLFFLKNIRYKIFNYLRDLFYGDQFYYHEREKFFSEEIYEIFDSKEFLNYFVTQKSEIILNYVENDLLDNGAIYEIFYTAISNKNSFLYRELKHADFNEGVMNYLLLRPEKIEKINLAHPIGESVLDSLEEFSWSEESKDINNRPNTNFDNKEKYESPIYLGIFLLRCIHLNSFEKDIPWHMEVYYFPRFIEGILKNLEPISDFSYEEFPSRYHYLIHECLSAMTDVVYQITRNLDYLDRENTKINKGDFDYENNNILKSTINAIGMSLKYILESDKIQVNEKENYIDSVFRNYINLRDEPSLDNYAKLYLKTIQYGGLAERQFLKEDIIKDWLDHTDFRLKPDSYEYIQEVKDSYTN